MAATEQTEQAVNRRFEAARISTETDHQAVAEPTARAKQNSKRADKRQTGNELVATEAADGAAMELKPVQRQRANKDEEQEVPASRDTLAAHFDR